MAFPPGSRLPAIAQAGLYGRDPLGFLIRFQRRYGDIFTVSFPFYKRLVYVADPALVKQLFTTSAQEAHAGEANATCSSRRSGRTRSSPWTRRRTCASASCCCLPSTASGSSATAS